MSSRNPGMQNIAKLLFIVLFLNFITSCVQTKRVARIQPQIRKEFNQNQSCYLKKAAKTAAKFLKCPSQTQQGDLAVKEIWRQKQAELSQMNDPRVSAAGDKPNAFLCPLNDNSCKPKWQPPKDSKPSFYRDPVVNNQYDPTIMPPVDNPNKWSVETTLF